MEIPVESLDSLGLIRRNVLTPYQLYVIGDPIKQSRSPGGWNALMEHFGINGKYEKFLVEAKDFEKVMKEFESDKHFLAANVTIPHKESAKRYLEKHHTISEDAEMIGAVNLILKTESGLIGYNTDWWGFGESLRKAGISADGKTVLVIGAGGAAKAIVYSFIMENADKIYVHNRTKKRAIELEEAMYELCSGRGIEIYGYGLNETKKDSSDTTRNIKESDILVNTTSVGMMGKTEDSSPLKYYQMKAAPRKVVCVDAIFNPRDTKFLKQGLRTWHKALTGEGMFAGQLKRGFEFVFFKTICREDEKIIWEGAFGPGSFKNYPGLMAPEQ